MYEFFTAVVAVVFVLGVMILVHEYGHYAAAKLLGVRVEVFSIGFGKRLIGFRRGETDYRISALPLGGYVKMSGENPMDSHTGDPAEFSAHPRWHRLIIAFAGPFANIVLAVAVMTGVYMFHYTEPVPAVIGTVEPGSPAAEAGIQPGDRIVAIANVQNPSFEDVAIETILSPDKPVNLTIQRGKDFLNKTVTPVPTGPNKAGEAGLVPQIPVIVDFVEKGMPAEKAGLKPGDQLVSVDGNRIHSVALLTQYLQQKKSESVQLTIRRNGEEQQLSAAATVKPGEGSYRLGFGSRAIVRQLPFAAALRESVEWNKRYAGLIFRLVDHMIHGDVSIKQVDGPIGIARASGEALRTGWLPLLGLMALISLNLGIFNLFPIPIMDGGVILLLLIESVMRRDISVKVKERVYQAAFIFLIMFAAVVIVNDITKLPGVAKWLQ